MRRLGANVGIPQLDLCPDAPWAEAGNTSAAGNASWSADPWPLTISTTGWSQAESLGATPGSRAVDQMAHVALFPDSVFNHIARLYPGPTT